MKFHSANVAKVKMLPHTETYGPERGMREGTELNPAPMAFFFNGGGLGDYINYSAACLWSAQHFPWIHGTIYVSSFLREFLSEIFAPYPNWQVRSGEKVALDSDVCFAGPDLNMGGQVINHQLLNATGAHLIDLGFAYYANMCPAPPEATLPYVNYPLKKLHFELRANAGKYVVFTPGAIVSSRCVSGQHLNPLIHWVRDRGYLPVFLGRSEVTPDLNPVFPDDIDYAAGLDLRNQTTITEAAAVMQHSAAVLGLDNGLLHLAACTDANVLFGYNITGPSHREPRRHPSCRGKTVNITLTKSDLACNHCQDNMKLLIGHTFHRCLYGDLRCIDLLFADSAARWKKELEGLLLEVTDAI